MPTILTCRLQFTLVGTVFQSEIFHTVEAARDVGKLGTSWVLHPSYILNPRHSNDPEVYGPARAQFLAAIGYAAAADRRANKMFQKAEDVRAAIGGKA